MKLFQSQSNRGFTLVEMVVVIGIIGLLSSVVLFSISQTRENTRDKTRLVDIEQLHLLFKLYREGFGTYPTNNAYDDGVEIGRGGSIDTELRKLQSSIQRDPKSSDGTYGYFYDSDFNCTGAGGEKVLYVKQFETLTDQANGTDANVCGGGTDATSDMYIILLR